MKESIYTIPISEVFEPKCGCPICTLHSQLEIRWVEYISGAAMMEPDIRIETNRQGFCGDHFQMMVEAQKRLSTALIIQSRLIFVDETLENITAEKKPLFGSKEKIRLADDCFVCERIDQEFSRIGENIVVVWQREHEFRRLYAQQEFLCYPHHQLLAQAGANGLRGAEAREFAETSAGLTRKWLSVAKENIDSFINLFDYRSAGGQRPSAEVATAIEAAICYLTGLEPKKSEEKKE